MRIQNPGWKEFGSRIWDGKKVGTGSRITINISDPQHWFKTSKDFNKRWT
jgi:hypothetical protein